MVEKAYRDRTGILRFMAEKTQRAAAALSESRAEQWIIRAFTFSFVLLVTYVGNELTQSVHTLNATVGQLQTDIATIRKELEIVKPADVLRAVHTLDREQLTRADVQTIVASVAPWPNEREEWQKWRQAIEARVRELERRE